MNNQLDKVFDKINLYDKEVLKKVFPESYLSSSEVWSSDKKVSDSFNGQISTVNLFNGTQYEYVGKNKFLHFTSIDSLFKILESGYIRMTDIYSLEDKSELHFASQVLGENYENEINLEGENTYSFSACESNADNLISDYMWREYGDNFKGCTIEFSFSKTDFHKMNLGKIQYGDEKLEPIINLKKYSEEFWNNYGIKVNKFPLFLLKILAFHKESRFSNENELRLLFHNDNGQNHPNVMYISCQKRGIKSFIKLPLKGRNEILENPNFDMDTKLYHSPQVEINRIILGSNVVLENLQKFNSKVMGDFTTSKVEVWFNKNGELVKLF